jgi:hypothetical protein
VRWVRREAPSGIFTLIGIGAGILGSVALAIVCFVVAAIWGVAAAWPRLRRLRIVVVPDGPLAPTSPVMPSAPPAPSSGPDEVAELSIVKGLVEVVRYQVNIAGLDNPAASFDIEFRVLSACLFPIRFKECAGTAQIYTRQPSDGFDRLGAISKRIEFIETYGPVGDPMTIYRGWPKWFTIRVWLDSDGRDELRRADQAKLAWRSINPTFVVVGHEDHELVLMPEELEMFGLPIKGPLSPIVVFGGED